MALYALMKDREKRDDAATLRKHAEDLADSLAHMEHCAHCGEDTWEECEGGRAALKALSSWRSGPGRTEGT